MDIDLKFFERAAKPFGINPALLMAMAKVESGLNPYAVRFEPKWRYHWNCKEFAEELIITPQTEEMLQATSWGLMQVMGTVAREMGFDRHLTELTEPGLNVVIACKKLRLLFNKYKKTHDVISAYNQGSPRRNKRGFYENQNYVDKVLKELKTLV